MGSSMFWPFKKLNIKAVSSLEYVLVMTVVMAGIITAGRFAYMGWYAQMKRLNTEKDHSYMETGVEPPPFNGDWGSGGCTGIVYDCCNAPPCCGMGGCDSQEECISIEKGDPLGCKPDVVTCAANNSCCTTPVPTPYCADEAPSAWVITCGYGHRVMEKYCGFNPAPIYECSAEIDPSCVESCLGEPDANSILCEEDDQEVPPGTYYSLIADEHSCTVPQKCETYCNWPPYWKELDRCVNCATQKKMAAETCHCTAHGGCPWGRKSVAILCNTCPQGTAPYAGATFHYTGRHYRATVSANYPDNPTNRWCGHSSVHRGQSGKGTCHATSFRTFAFCLPTDKSDPGSWKPDKNCKFKILVDYKVQGAGCPSDYHILQTWGTSFGANHCVKYEHWAPFLNPESQQNPPCIFTDVVGDVFTGYWSSAPNDGNYYPVPQVNALFADFYSWKQILDFTHSTDHGRGSRALMKDLTCRISQPGEAVPIGWNNGLCPRIVQGFSDVYSVAGTSCPNPDHKFFGTGKGYAFCGVPVELCVMESSQ